MATEAGHRAGARMYGKSGSLSPEKVQIPRAPPSGAARQSTMQIQAPLGTGVQFLGWSSGNQTEAGKLRRSSSRHVRYMLGRPELGGSGFPHPTKQPVAGRGYSSLPPPPTWALQEHLRGSRAWRGHSSPPPSTTPNLGPPGAPERQQGRTLSRQPPLWRLQSFHAGHT